jgi:hypothetical protein
MKSFRNKEPTVTITHVPGSPYTHILISIQCQETHTAGPNGTPFGQHQQPDHLSPQPPAYCHLEKDPMPANHAHGPIRTTPPTYPLHHQHGPTPDGQRLSSHTATPYNASGTDPTTTYSLQERRKEKRKKKKKRKKEKEEEERKKERRKKKKNEILAKKRKRHTKTTH